jgi:hypothetical protein
MVVYYKNISITTERNKHYVIVEFSAQNTGIS